MIESEFSKILEECLQEMRAGDNLENVLARRPHYSAELRPLLEAAQWVADVSEGNPLQIPAQSRARARFLAAAVKNSQPARRSGWLQFRFGQFSNALALILVLAFVLVFSVGIVSAQALPGDPLYPVKIAIEQTHLRLVNDPSSRLTLENQLDGNRLQEINRLLSNNRKQEVVFSGFLTQSGTGGWQVSGIPVNLADNEQSNVDKLLDTYVEVDGQTDKELVTVNQLHARIYQLEGNLQQEEGNTWKVGGILVNINPDSGLNKALEPGTKVQISAIREKDDRWVAVSDNETTPGIITPENPPQSEASPVVTEPTQSDLPPDSSQVITVQPSAPETIIVSTQPEVQKNPSNGITGPDQNPAPKNPENNNPNSDSSNKQ
jgi:hypothetical protein